MVETPERWAFDGKAGNMFTEAAKDTGYAPERWAFDDKVTNVFDDMFRRSIPQHDEMRQAVYELACKFQQPQMAFVDLGCSRGEAMAPLVDRFGAYNRFVGIEMSEPMLQAARDRFAGMIDCKIVDIRKMDLREEYPPVLACVTLCVLTMVFIPINYRQRIIEDVYRTTAPGGAFIMVDKVLGNTSKIDAMMIDQYYALKRKNGYTNDEIERKRLSLEGVQVPVTARWNEDMLRSAGFNKIDCFWRWMNFAGWVAIK